jgi:multidrug efflux pump
LQISSDRTPTIRASLTEVERTLLITIGFHMAFSLSAQRELHADPGVAVPVSLIGKFGVMYWPGYTLTIFHLG